MQPEQCIYLPVEIIFFFQYPSWHYQCCYSLVNLCLYRFYYIELLELSPMEKILSLIIIMLVYNIIPVILLLQSAVFSYC